MLNHLFVVNQLFRFLYFRSLDIKNSNCIYWFHYMNNLFPHQFLPHLFKFLELI